MLSRKSYIIYIIFLLCNFFYLSSCQMYPLYYYGTAHDKKYINPIEVFVSNDLNKEITRNFHFLLSHVLTHRKYKLNVVLVQSIDNISVESYFNNTKRINLKAAYSLHEISKKNVLYKSSAEVTSLFDFSNQQFSKMRINKNIEEKTAAELAENISIDIISFIKSID
ncbi:MAG: hypothetical protein EU981_01365 [Candidatus Liberibacter ctenarytainae]|uniref:LPS-assembly lipoprotein n=1 Tax=Candidatus Liberibacter ctenarytainae TaxID=2020335 RepID=A0A937DIV1_9HYPH|nr:hypothetical protein [Candidatus Liberibacter ctenarytainae]